MNKPSALALACLLTAPVPALARSPDASSSAQRPPPSSSRPLVGTYWRAIELGGKATPPAQDAAHEAHLQFETDGRVSGSDGCNRTTGGYTLNGESLTFGRMAATQMACLDTGDTERSFREALQGTTRWRITGERLELFSGRGARLAVFEARAQPASAASSELQGTSWHLVRFQGGDGTVLTPDDRTKYTIAFGAGGQLTARIDCNRGRGTWESPGASQLVLGPLALTRAQCPPGSLHDQIARQWDNIRSYAIRDGHLFLALAADGGTYEFERPAAGVKQPG